MEATYTTQLQAGLGLVEETKELLSLYEGEMNASELYERAMSSGAFPTITARRLRNIVSECFSPRYLKSDAAGGLKQLSPNLPSLSLRQLFLIHTALANHILLDFIAEVYWAKYAAGQDELTADDARRFVENAVNEGKTQTHWSESTIKRVSSYVLGCCADYDLLAAGRSTKRRIQPQRITPSTSLYLAYWLHFSGLGDNAVINHKIWRLFGLEANEVRAEFKNLAKHGWLIVQAAADITRVTWKLVSMQEVIDVIVES